MDNGFVTTMIMEGLHRYGSRNSALEKRMQDVLGENASAFLREVESFVRSQAVSIVLLTDEQKSLEEFDSIVMYAYPPHAQNNTPPHISLDDEQYRIMYNELVKEYSSVDEELTALLESDPALATLANSLDVQLQKKVWREKSFVKPNPVKEEKVHPVEYENDFDGDMYDY